MLLAAEDVERIASPSHGHEQLGRSKHLGIGPLARAQPSTRCKGPRSVRDAEQEHHLELEALRTVECADFDGIGELASVVLQVHAVEAGFPEGLHRGVDIVVGRRKCAEIAKAQGSVGAEGLDLRDHRPKLCRTVRCDDEARRHAIAISFSLRCHAGVGLTEVVDNLFTRARHRRLDDLARGIAALTTDLGDRMQQVLVLTMSEFGRAVAENGNRGTDHGHGNAMLVIGGDVRGGQVYGQWPGLTPEQRFEGRDLAVTTDFRDVFGEVVVRHLGLGDPAPVFPGHEIRESRFVGFLKG